MYAIMTLLCISTSALLQELRLVDCDWRQLLDMLPWEWACGLPGGEQGKGKQQQAEQQQGQQAQGGTPAVHPLGSQVGIETERGGPEGIGQGPSGVTDGAVGPVGSIGEGRYEEDQQAGPQAAVLGEAEAEADAGAATTLAAAAAVTGAWAGACSARGEQAGAACTGRGRGGTTVYHGIPPCSGRACGTAAAAASSRTAAAASGHAAVGVASVAFRGCSTSGGSISPREAGGHVPAGACTCLNGRAGECPAAYSTGRGGGLPGQHGAEERGGAADGGALLNAGADLEDEHSDSSVSCQSSRCSSSNGSPRRGERGEARNDEPRGQEQEGAAGASCGGKCGTAGLEPAGTGGQDQHRAGDGAGAAGREEAAGGGSGGSGAQLGAAAAGDEGGAVAAVGSGSSIAASPTAAGLGTGALSPQGPAAAADGGRLAGGSKRECPLRLLQVGASGPRPGGKGRLQGRSEAPRPSVGWQSVGSLVAGKGGLQGRVVRARQSAGCNCSWVSQRVASGAVVSAGGYGPCAGPVCQATSGSASSSLVCTAANA